MKKKSKSKKKKKAALKKEIEFTAPSKPKLTSSQERKQSQSHQLQEQWKKRPAFNKLKPSAAEVKKFQEEYKLWQMETEKLIT